MSRYALSPRVVLALTAASCGGGDLCEKYAHAFEGCEADTYSVEQCQEELASCDSHDQKLLDEFFQCAEDEGLFECDVETTPTSMTDAFAMVDAIFACAEPLEELSEECQGGMMTGSTNATFF